MRIQLRRSLSVVLIVLMAGGMALLLLHSRKQRTMETCQGLTVELVDEFRFVTEDDIKNFLDRNYGSYIGQCIDSVRLDRIEEMIGSRNVIMGCEAWISKDNMLHVKILQRAPAVRFQRGDQGFYMDCTGYTFPLHPSYTAKVRTISGNIPDLSGGNNAEWAAGVLELLKFIDGSKAWKNRVSDIIVNAAGDIELRIGEDKLRFIFGEPEKFTEKFDKIDKYYTYIGTGNDDAPKYKSVNLKYNKQLICRKDI